MRKSTKEIRLSLWKWFSCIVLAGILLVGFNLSLIIAQNNFSKTRLTTSPIPGRSSAIPTLNADGTRIAFVSEADFLGQGIPAGQYEIWLYDTDTMTLTRVTTAASTGLDSRWPNLSASGKEIALESETDLLNGSPNGQSEIWLYHTDTTTFTRVTTASAAFRGSYGPRISADGRKVAFHSDSDFFNQGISAGQHEIWSYDTNAITVTRITTASASSRQSVEPSINTDGTKIAFRSDSDFLNQGIPSGQFEIWLYEAETMTVTRVTTASSANRGSYEPGISADGTQITFYSDSDFLGQAIPDEQYEIWLYDTDLMTVTRITTASIDGRDSYQPNISADGLKIIYTEIDLYLGIPTSYYTIWLYDRVTKNLVRITNPPASGQVSRAPSLNMDGTKVAFESAADFSNQGEIMSQLEIWLFSSLDNYQYLPVLLK